MMGASAICATQQGGELRKRTLPPDLVGFSPRPGMGADFGGAVQRGSFREAPNRAPGLGLVESAAGLSDKQRAGGAPGEVVIQGAHHGPR